MSQLPESQIPDPPQPPASVSALATEHRLGELRNARIVPHPAAIAKIGAVILVPSAIVAVVGLSRERGILPILGLVALVGVGLGLLILVYAAKTWLVGADDWYLYTQGVVASSRRQLRAATWSEVSSLTRRRMGLRARRGGTIMNPDTVRGYSVVLKDGTDVFLNAVDASDTARRLGSELEQLASQAGIPVTG
jgi:hypothetical protein